MVIRSILRGRIRFLVPALYLGLATYTWIDFVRAPPDGLANVGLMLVTFPVTIFGLLLTWALGETEFMLMPSGFGYYSNHAVYYWPSVGLITAALYWLCAAFGRGR